MANSGVDADMNIFTFRRWVAALAIGTTIEVSILFVACEPFMWGAA